MKSNYVIGDIVIVDGSRLGIFTPMYLECEVIQLTDNWGIKVRERKRRLFSLRRKSAWISWTSINGKVVEYAPDGTPILGSK